MVRAVVSCPPCWDAEEVCDASVLAVCSCERSNETHEDSSKLADESSGGPETSSGIEKGAGGSNGASVTSRDSKEEAIVLREVLDCRGTASAWSRAPAAGKVLTLDDRIVGLGRSVHLGEHLPVKRT